MTKRLSVTVALTATISATTCAGAAAAPAGYTSGAGAGAPAQSSYFEAAPRANAAALPLLAPAASVVVRVAAAPAARAGARAVAGVVRSHAPRIGRRRTGGAIKDARTVTRRSRRDGPRRTRRWLRKRWRTLGAYSAACLAGAAESTKTIFEEILAGEPLPNFADFARKGGVNCGSAMAAVWWGRLTVSKRLR